MKRNCCGLRRLQDCAERAFTARFTQQTLGFPRTLAATGRNAQFTLQIAKSTGTGFDGATDVALIHTIADTDIHAGRDQFPD